MPTKGKEKKNIRPVYRFLGGTYANKIIIAHSYLVMQPYWQGKGGAVSMCPYLLNHTGPHAVVNNGKMICQGDPGKAPCPHVDPHIYGSMDLGSVGRTH